MKLDEMVILLRSVGCEENTVTAMINAYELGFEYGFKFGVKKMIDPNDLVTLPLIDPACKQLFCNFVGDKAFEDDGGWSYEVWQAAWNAALICVEKKFKHEDGISFHGNEVAHVIRQHVQK